jgi:hypothetical protein
MNRLQFQQLAEDRALDAQVLLAAGRWSAAYYLAGYAVECGLKSCILAYLTGNPGIIFEDNRRRYSDNCWTHDLDKLVELADLEQQRATAIQANPTLGQKWLIVKDWSERSRYEQKTQAEAETLCDATTNQHDGVLAWIKNHW